MKTTFSLLLAILVGGVLTGCEHWHHHDYRGGPAEYEHGRYEYHHDDDAYHYGIGPHYDQGWDHR